MHINDSKCPLGSRRDRHENVGHGMIGIKMFECIMNDSRLDGARKIYMILRCYRKLLDSTQSWVSCNSQDQSSMQLYQLDADGLFL